MPCDAPRGRGSSFNPPNRFERLAYEPDPEEAGAGAPALKTEVFRDTTRSIISTNDSPDIPFAASINPYRGCEHGCIYCYARPYHEYLGMSAGLDFESRIMVKEDAAELLREELMSPRWEPKVLALCGVTDAYQPIERKLGIARRCLEVLCEFRNPVVIVTKGRCIERDTDLLADLARDNAAAVYISLTTLDPEIAREMEPRAPSPEARLGMVGALSGAGIPTGIIMGPIIPGLTDSEIPAVVTAAANAGAKFATYTVVRLPGAVEQLFADWLQRRHPLKKDKILHRISELRGGKLNDPRFKTRMTGEGVFADQIRDLFRLARKRAGIEARFGELSTAAFRRPERGQLDFFG